MKKTVKSAANKCFNMNKRADLSINMIIIAVLGLLILVVLAFIFSNKINIFGKGVSNCAGKCQTIITDDSPSQTCDKYAEEQKQAYTYNPSGNCGDDPKKKPVHACCILAYT